ncbi:hypothetical protein Y032_0644g1075 [Ancylostoma ceylanicum]|nr:hypothetical protein Y032_0644g1075 [Ancylostoma ceylanicum]
MRNQWRKVGIEGVRSWRHGNDGHETELPADHLQQLALVLHENKMLLTLLPFFHAAAAQGDETIGNSSLLPSLYCVVIELSASIVRESDSEIARRLSLVVGDALNAANALHLRQPTNFNDAFADRKVNRDIQVKIVKRVSHGNITSFYFIAFHQEKPISGDVVGDDMNLLSSSHISAVLQYPLHRIISQDSFEQSPSSTWWIIALMIGSGVLILCFGWCLLFMYLNVCGARRIAYEISKTVYQNDASTQCDFPSPHHHKATYLEPGMKKTLLDSPKERAVETETTAPLHEVPRFDAVLSDGASSLSCSTQIVPRNTRTLFESVHSSGGTHVTS